MLTPAQNEPTPPQHAAAAPPAAPRPSRLKRWYAALRKTAREKLVEYTVRAVVALLFGWLLRQLKLPL
ncbi:hypothetical protein J0H58_35075 [bacterium]|nr:hypothetical protein [bacterium]